MGARKKSSFHGCKVHQLWSTTEHPAEPTDTRYYVFTLESKDYSIASYIQHISYATYHYKDNMCSDKCMMCAFNSTCNTHLICVFIAACVQTCVTSVSCGLMINVHVWTCMLCADNLMVIKMWQSNTDPLSPEDVCTVHDTMGWCWIVMPFVILIVYVLEQNIKGCMCMCMWRLKIFWNAAQI